MRHKKLAIHSLITFLQLTGFGGNVVRESVKSHAPWFISDFKDLIAAL